MHFSFTYLDRLRCTSRSIEIHAKFQILLLFSIVWFRVLMDLKYIWTQTLELVFTYSRGEFYVHRSRDFSYFFGATARDLVQTTNPIIKRSCCIQSTTVVDLNLWVEISKSQAGKFVLLIQIFEWRFQSHNQESLYATIS